MGVSPPKTKAVDACAQRSIGIGWPRGSMCRYLKLLVEGLNFWIQLVEMHIRGDAAILDGQRRLEEACQTGTAF